MHKTKAEKITALINEATKIENELLIRKNKNLHKNLCRLIAIKRKLVSLNYSNENNN